MDDDELIAAVVDGDDVALRELFSRHAPWLAARLRAVLPPADVEDVLQETFLAVWRGAAGYRREGAGGWLWGIARRQAALWLRRRGRADAVPAALAAAENHGPGTDPAWELSCSMATSDRMVLMVRALAVFGLNAALGLAASAASGTATAVTFGWLLPMTAVCALALAAATVARSANVGVAAGVAGWLIAVLSQRSAAGQLTSAVTDSALKLPYLALAACCVAIVVYATRIERGIS